MTYVLASAGKATGLAPFMNGVDNPTDSRIAANLRRYLFSHEE